MGQTRSACMAWYISISTQGHVCANDAVHSAHTLGAIKLDANDQQLPNGGLQSLDSDAGVIELITAHIYRTAAAWPNVT